MAISVEKFKEFLPRLAGPVAALAVCLAAFLMLLRILVHFPYYDESMHAHYQWLVAQGLKPSIDFFSAYPALVYLWLAPLVREFPDSAFAMYALRLVSFAALLALGWLMAVHSRKISGSWFLGLLPLLLLAATSEIGPFFAEFSVDRFSAVAAFASVVFLFSAPTGRTVFLASAFSLLSVLITPKFALPLFFALLGHLAAFLLAEKNWKKLAGMVALGGLAALGLAWTTFAASGSDLFLNLKNSAYLSSKVSVERGYGLMATASLKYLAGKPALALTLLLGVAGWGVRSWRKRDAEALAGGGMLLGTVLFGFTIKLVLEQHQSAYFLSVAALSPFAVHLTKSRAAKGALSLLLAFAALGTVAAQYPATAREFELTAIYGRDVANPGLTGPPAMKALYIMEEVMNVVPPSETVVANWPYHPVFRRDLTPMTGDDRPSYKDFLDKDDPMREWFEPGTLARELVLRPPALIDVARSPNNMPLGWTGTLTGFLDSNVDNYVEIKSLYEQEVRFYLRKDLVKR